MAAGANEDVRILICYLFFHLNKKEIKTDVIIYVYDIQASHLVGTDERKPLLPT